MAASKTIKVPHLGGIVAGYKLSADTYDPSKPTCVLINSMCTTTSLYQTQFESEKLTTLMNLLAIEPLGHGSTSSPKEHFTYWDSAIMALQVMDGLGIQKAFALGTSQGGWIVARMALLAPDRILGIMPLGTSMDYESPDSRTKGCWDPVPLLSPFYEKWTSTTATPEFVVDDVWCGMVSGLGLGEGASADLIEFWNKTVKEVYSGDEGRKKLRMAGTNDVPFGITAPGEQIKLFTGSKEAKLVMVEGGAHYLNATNPTEVNDALVDLVNKYK
ncbi:hypothetical protein FQN50_007599 [Emmonsiellopsis sp. PD_5]|nr:hypothetical protein FQN50_007599 [Emmonsiellopsis sp. PD_5]